MKFIKYNNFTYVEDFQPEELALVRRILMIPSTEYSSGGSATVYEHFLYVEDNTYKFFTGLVDWVISNIETFQVEIEDRTTKKSFSVKVTNDMLDGIDLRDDQVFSIKKCFQFSRGIIDLPTRTGKTEVFCGVSRLYQSDISKEKKILIIEDQKGLMEQTAERMKLRGVQNVGLLGDGKADFDCQAIVCTIDTLYNNFRKGQQEEFFNSVGAIIVDECFVAGTLVDGVPIETIKEGDLVKSFNHANKKIEYKKVKKVFKNQLKGELYFIEFSKGSKIICTENHPIYDWKTDTYVNAKDLTGFSRVHYFQDSGFPSIIKEPWLDLLIPLVVRTLTPEEKERYCRDNIVYNIEVEDNNNYFAEGILVHNCHHMGAESYLKLTSSFRDLDLLLGFSGTPLEDRNNPYKTPRDVSIMGVFHKVIVRISPKFFIDKGIISEPNVFFVPYEYKKPPIFIQNYGKVYDRFIVSNKNRNEVASHISRYCYQRNLSFLLSISRIEHGKKMLNLLSGLTDVVFSYGDNTNISLLTPELQERYSGQIKDVIFDKDISREIIKYNKDFDLIKEVNSKNIRALIGSSVFDEGRDIPSLDGAILLAGGSSYTKTIQRPARALTKSDTRSKSFIIDFEDNVHIYLKNHSNTRKRLYEENYYNVSHGISEFIQFLNSL